MRHSTIVVGNDHGGIGGLGTRATAPVERQSRRLSEEILPHFGNGIDQKADLETTFAEEIIKCPIEEKTDEKFEVA